VKQNLIKKRELAVVQQLQNVIAYLNTVFTEKYT